MTFTAHSRVCKIAVCWGWRFSSAGCGAASGPTGRDSTCLLPACPPISTSPSRATVPSLAPSPFHATHSNRIGRAARVEVLYTVIQSLTVDGRDRSLDYKFSGFHVPPNSWDAQVWRKTAAMQQ